MNVILPVAGVGARLRPHTLHRPKPLLHVAGDTVLGHVLRSLEATLTIDRAVFVVGHLGEQVEAWVRTNRADLDSRFVSQPEPRGQAHALWFAREHLAGPLVVVFGDTVFDIDLAVLEYVDPSVDGVLHLMEVDDPRRHGIAMLRADGTVERLVEKPESLDAKRAVVGVYYVRDGARLAAAIDRVLAGPPRTHGEHYSADAFQVMLDDGARFVAHPVRAWEDCGTVEALLYAQRAVFRRRPPVSSPTLAGGHPTAVLVPPVHIAPGTVVERSVVGPYVHVGPRCRIVDSVVGPFASFEADVEVDRMVAMDVIGQAGARLVGGVRERAVVSPAPADGLAGARDEDYNGLGHDGETQRALL